MSGAIFQKELSGLIQESRRKHPDVKAAAEKSLGELKALHVTSEAQLAADLHRKPSFVDPFVLACKSRNAKLVSSSVVCLQRLAASHALPSHRLKDVLDAFREVTSSGFDVQIKILQTLPSLLHTYSSDVHGDLLFICLEICGALQNSKTTVLGSTASATLQQLVASTFERTADEDDAADSEILTEVQIGHESVSLGKAAIDSFEIFNDLCAIADGVAAKRLKWTSISPIFVLDLIMTILASNEKIFQTHAELLFICRTKLMSAVIRRLSAKHGFPVTVRSLRILHLLIGRHLDNLRDESETALSLLIHLLDPEASQGWKRAACMELLRNVVQNFPLLRQIFNCFDIKEGRKDVVNKMMSTLAKIAAEKPAVIGMGHQSTMPARYTDEERDGQGQTSLEAAGMEGVIAGTVTADSDVTGISAVWSWPKTPCLEQLDKNDAPSLPDTYIYSLVLDCMSSLSEGLAKAVMPLNMARGERRKTELRSDDRDFGSSDNKDSIAESANESEKPSKMANSARLTPQPQSQSIKMVTALVSTCWPAVLATCATFLNATLDAESYHSLIRAIQKFAQVSGILELSTPRDALLTTLAKAAVPSQTLQTGPIIDGRKAESYFTVRDVEDSSPIATGSVGKSITETRAPPSMNVSPLTRRNLLCVRALLNLGIALGPTLSQQAWYIVLETLQEAEHLIKTSLTSLMSQNGRLAEKSLGSEDGTSQQNLGGEIAAVETASKKLLASTDNYENGAFLGLVKALLSLSGLTESIDDRKELVSPTSSSTRRAGRMHQSSRSTSGTSSKTATEDNEVLFVLSKTSEIAKFNLHRFVRDSEADSGWSLITVSLLRLIKSSITASGVRLRAASLLDTIVLGTMQFLEDEDEVLQRDAQRRAISVLRCQIEGLYQQGAFASSEHRQADIEIHEHALDTLTSIVEQHGENFLISWETIFKLAGTIFEEHAPAAGSSSRQNEPAGNVRVKSVKLLPIAFRLFQLIGSDFLNLLPLNRLLDFITILLCFGCQHDDLNVSLTSTTFFWNLADFLQSSQNHSLLSDLIDVPTEDFLISQINSTEDRARVGESLWLVLLLRLNTLTVDSRSEVRNSAIRVMLRILDASGSSLSSRGWHICLCLVFIRLLESHTSVVTEIQTIDSDIDPTSFEDWYTSMVALLEGSISLICHFIHIIAVDEQFSVFWKQLFELLECILTTSSLPVSFAVFHGVTLLFLSLKKADYHDGRTAEPALKLWIQRHPADIITQSETLALAARDPVSNQEAFTAHAEALVRISEAFPLLRIDEVPAKEMMQALKKTILRCVHSRYGSDVRKLAPEQEYIIAIVQLLSETRTSTRPEYHKTLLIFIQVALKDESEIENDPSSDLPAKQGVMSRHGQRPSFVAFASRIMEIVEGDITRMVQHESLVDHSLAISSALNVFSEAINAKYSANGQRGDPLLWRKATAHTLAMVEGIGSHKYQEANKDLLAVNEIYTSAIDLAASILGSGSLKDTEPLPDGINLIADEEHDMAAFKRLLVTLIPALIKLKDSSPADPRYLASDIRRKFIVSLFQASMISIPQYADLPSEKDLFSSPLSTLLQVRPGTIKQIIYHVRSKIPYLALDTIFSLASAFAGNKAQNTSAFTSHVALARTTAPYLLLHAAHPLKSFIADQPLRGPMPMPSKLRAEMIHVLRACLELRSEDEAFVGKPGSHVSLGRDGKRHLRVLYPLILRVWRVWRRVPRLGGSWITGEDGVEIEELLHRWTEVCGEDWELATFES
jgi:Dimerisation and cyclophilin-binding domain of Mon2/Guanine nucleotide exchange factor in Golgi transport N-terminal/C-terminal region of Mon2 protein